MTFHAYHQSNFLLWESHYIKPTCDDTAVVFAYFSPTPYTKTLENFNSVQARLQAAQIPNFSAELLVGDQQPRTRADYFFCSDAAMFYKENLWNLLTKRIPEQYTKLVFIDADVVFSEPRWLDLCSNLLCDADVIQPMEWCLTADSSHVKRSIACGISNRDLAQLDVLTYHPGFGVGVRREWLDSVGGFYDQSILGSGDVVFWSAVAKALFDDKNTHEIWPIGKTNLQKYCGIPEYTQRIRSHVPRVNFAQNVKAVHMPHGQFSTRKYTSRLNTLQATELAVVSKNKDGVYEWSDPMTPAKQKIANYFAAREEDGPQDVADRLNRAWNTFKLDAVPIRCISLARASERRDYMELRWCRERRTYFQFFNAYDKNNNLVFENGADGGVLPYTDAAAYEKINRRLSQGERACRLSHFLCAQELLRDYPDAPLYVICEDDAEPLFAEREDFFRRIVYGFYEHDVNLDVLICHNIWCDANIKKRGLFSLLLEPTPTLAGPFGTVCMAFSRVGLQKYCDALEMCCPADNWRFWNPTTSRLACLTVNAVRHKDETTYIGNFIGRGMHRKEM